MKIKNTTGLLLTIIGLAVSSGAASAEGTPKIQFNKTFYDFGKTSQVATVSGVFTFKNTGDGLLKLEAPKPSCGCTVAELKQDTLAPGATGELSFTLSLGFTRAIMEKHIAVRSNDPLTPETSLTIQVDYTPLYELNPMTLSPNLAFGANDTVQFTTLKRTDGKPLQIARMDSSKPWITATVVPGTAADKSSASVRIEVKRDGAPRRFNEYVHFYVEGQSNSPVSSIYLSGQIMGEVSLSPEALYWSITDATKPVGENAEAQITRRVTIRSAKGSSIKVKNPQSTIAGLKLELVPGEAGKSYELIARLDSLPAATVAGNISFETSVAAQSRIEVPVIINVFKP